MTPHALGLLHSLHLGVVVDNADPDNRGRIEVKLQATDIRVWASVISLSAGNGYGASFVPRIDEVVVLAFVTPELPLVLGSIWSGQDSMIGEADAVEDNYVIKTPAGTIMQFDDANGPKVEINTPSGYRMTITDGNGGEIEIVRGGESIKLSSSGIDIQSSSKVNITAAASVNVSAAMVKVDAAMSKFSGVVQADTVITNSVVSASYTPGAGNVW